METSCHELTEGGRLVAVEPTEAIARWRAGGGAFWIDLHDFDQSEMKAMLDEIAVTGFLRQGCLQTGNATTAIAVPKGTFAEWAVFADRACTRRAQFGALCLKDLLVTMHAEPLERSDEMYRTIDLLELDSLSTSSVLFAVFMEQATDTARATRAIRDLSLELGERMDRDPGDVEAVALEQMKRQVLLTDSIAEEQEEALELLANARTEGLDLANLGGPIGLLGTTVKATGRLIDRLDGRAANLLRRYQDHKQELLNRRLGVLTIVSAIFLPLTLLAGIWGMNFERMPELSHPYAYPMALSLMALVGVLAAWSFYKRGWFD